ncbi:SDR family oxidoreductase [Calothrix sp. PCC 7507]|uniref:SDR family oxidoreductase n=1 Tax=Calothrix sp. PCC 7507 TaxID=99598 RepID=UPI00029EC3BB|nr:SDR family oxidoreductase [Calothrix sp. PCC 7507]AFY33395.1 3-oxoacyl-(acyl-carrier-protein) reductase [Calothrix sp. PCC 7507]
MKDLENKIALITGGSSGIGRATTLAFAKRGAKVVIGSRRIAESEETLELVKAAGSEGISVQTDVSNSAEIEALVNQAVSAYGRIDYAFNNAGIEGIFSPLVEQTEENWDSVININLKGVWLSLKYEILQMLKQGGGAIVNNSSIAGLIGFPDAAAYVASKHGVIGLTKTAALEYAKSGIRVNAVSPAVIATDMVDRAFGDEGKAQMAAAHPIGRIGRVEEVAEAVVWLCSDAASFVTGQSLAVDGGYTTQ